MIAAADGNPLLALESARAAARGDDGPPASLRGAVRAAIAGLDEPARRAAELAAVAGRPLDRVELSALAPPEAVLAAMDCGLFRSADGRFGFRHDLLREAALADLDDARRALLHEALGRALGARAAEAARHLRLAGRDDLAVDAAGGGGRRRDAGDRARRGGGVPRGGGRAAPGRPARAAASWPRRSRSWGAASTRSPRSTPRVALIDPADAGARVARAPARRALVPQLAVRPDAGAPLRPARRSTRSTAAGPTTSRCARELLLIRAWSEVDDRTARAPPTRRSPSSTRSGSTSRPRRCSATTSTTCAASCCSPKGGWPRPRRRWSPRARPASAPAGPTSPTAAGRTPPASRRALGARERALEYAAARRGQDQRRSRRSTSRWPACAPARSRCSGAIDEARAASDRQAELAARLASPELVAVADHDGGLLALLAGDHERAAELLGRALAGDPPVQRAEARLRRAEALARLGRAGRGRRRDPRRRAGADPRRPPPGRARRADDVRPGAERARARRPRARRTAAARGRGPLAPARRRRRRRARAPRLARRPRAPAGHRRRRPGRASSSAWPRSCADWRPLPTFDDSATSARAGRGGVEAPLRPGAHGRVVGGDRDASSPSGDGRHHDLPATATRTSRCRRSCAPPPTAAA